MKQIRTILSVFLIVIVVSVFHSCSKDATPVAPKVTTTETNNLPQGQRGEITLYKVSGDVITKITDYQVSGADLAFQKDIAKHNEIWELVKKIVPKDQRVKMTQFLIYNGETTGSAGFVTDIKQDLSEWKMGIAINFAYQGGFNTNGEVAYTIIHEFGHILTLNDTQLNASVSQNSCTNYFPGEGCAKSSSYIDELFQKHWKDIWDEYQKAKENQSSQQAFYKKYQSRFVTRYASTNPAEDIAEVFATFVTRNDKPSGTTVAEKKILLLYNRSELVAFRDHIRKNLNLRSRGNTNGFILPKPGSWKQANTIGNPYKTNCRH